MKCKLNVINGKDSELFKELLKVSKTEELATEAWKKAHGTSFREKFGATKDIDGNDTFIDWTTDYNSEEKSELHIYPDGEPKLFEVNGQYFFKTKQGNKIFINNPKFPEFTLEQVNEVTSQLLYHYIYANKEKDFNDSGAMNHSSFLPKSIDNTLDSYLAEHPEDKEKIELVRKYKDDFASEIVDRIEAAGYIFDEEVIDKDGKIAGDIDEKDKVEVLNLKEKWETSSKDSAKANTKLLLSQVLKVEDVLSDGKRSVKSVKGDFLKMHTFEDFDEVWATIEPIMADIVGYGETDGEIVDVFSQMLKKISDLREYKPWASTLKIKLQQLTIEKKLEFVQAFSNARLNFNVTEYSENNNTYTVINATNTNSKGARIKNKWSQKFKEKFIKGTQVSTESRKFLKEVQKDITKSHNKYIKDNNNLEKKKDYKGTPGIGAYNMNKKELVAILTNLGIELNTIDFKAYILGQGRDNSFESMNSVYEGLNYMISSALKNEEIVKNGEYKSPLDSESVFTKLADAKGMNSKDMSDNVILMNKGKMIWTYSKPTYLHNKVNIWKRDLSALKRLNSIKFNKNSLWAKFMTGNETEDGEAVNRAKDRDHISKNRIDNIKLSIAGSFKSRGQNDGADTKEITKTDAINDAVVKMLGSKINKRTIFPTIIAADKSKKIELEGFEFFDSKVDFGVTGIDISEETIDVFEGYFEDELSRMKQVEYEIENLPSEQHIVHYHTGRKNGLKSQLFPGLSMGEAPEDIAKLLYKGNKVIDTGIDGLNQIQKDALRPYIKKALQEMVEQTIESFEDNKIIEENTSGYKNLTLSKDLMVAYSGRDSAIHAIAGDYAINGLIAAVEYGKIFSGDPAYYKNTVDMIKRIPGTYTDGLQLEISTEGDLKLNVAVVEGVEEASRYHELIAESFEDKTLAKAYEKVNTTDAQAWITPSRWKFIMKKTGKWSPLHDRAYSSMMNGKKLSQKELKLVMQPLKGVYFGMNEEGVPTYLKYSQAVLIKSLVKGNAMQRLYDKMTIDPETNEPYADKSNEIHEVITIDGVKVGATGLTKIHEDNSTNLKEEFELNKVTLSNRNWKLQQDLPTKLDKQMNLGSQIQKNILDELVLNLENEYDFNNGTKGKKLLEEIHRTVGALSDIGVEKVKKKFGIGEDNKITDKSLLYTEMIKEFKGRGANENVIAALEKEVPLDSIPQLGNSPQSVFMSMVNRDIVKIKTNGSAFIQVSPFGFEQMTDAKSSGIKIISENFNGEGLLPPRKVNGKVLPGQAFVPASAIQKFLPEHINIATTPAKDLMKYIDKSALEVITYRIPNQGMSSNDMLEIVGILPEGMGDSIMAYDGIPAKTGSDFDIDKMFAMLPNYRFNKKTNKVEAIPDDLKTNNKSALQNRLFNLYKSILLNPNNYDNMMKSIDSEALKTDITKKLYPEGSMEDLQLFSPSQQINTKFEYMSGKIGVAQTANQLVDHIYNQSLDISLSQKIGIGQDKMDKVFNEDGVKIADILSEFLNAYVDIAKEPYISVGNHNNITANTAFLLIRAGVGLEMVNRFIGQPIIHEYVKLKKLTEGKSAKKLKSNGRNVTVEEYIESQYNIPDMEGDASIADMSKSDLEKAVKGPKLKGMSESERIFQGQVFAEYLRLQKLGLEFTKSVGSSKADSSTNGSAIARHIASNKIQEVLDAGIVNGFEEKVKGSTSLATFTYNAIDWLGEVFEKSDIFLTGKAGISRTFDLISTRAGRGVLTEEELGRTMEKGLKSYLASKMGIFNEFTENDYKDLFEELPKRLLKAQLTSKNPFILALETKFSGNKTYIRMNSNDKPKHFQNQMYRGWNVLLNSDDPKEKALGEDLVKYSYFQSGFQSNKNQFFTHVPHEYLMDNGLVSNGEASFDDSMNLITDDNFLEQFYRHNYKDDKLVPTVSGKSIELKKGFFSAGGFFYNKGKNDPLMQRGGTYPQFVKVQTNQMQIDAGEASIPEYNLYKLYGGIAVDDDIKMAYIPTHKLGTKSNHGSVFEYSYDNKSKKSNIKENNLTDAAKKLYSKFYLDIRNDLVVNPENYLADLDDGLNSNIDSKGSLSLGWFTGGLFGEVEEYKTSKPKGYGDKITPGKNVIFVFGSNPEGRHGKRAALVARNKFGAKYGQGVGLQGNAYALPTKDLRVKKDKGLRSISPETITESIKDLYDTARENPEKMFKVAYTNKADEATLNGYTGAEMIKMFTDAGVIPDNVQFSDTWVNSGLLYEQAQEQRNVFGEEEETMDDFAKKVEFLKSKMNVEVILDPDVETSRVLASTDPRSIAAGKPVIVINPNKVFKTTAIHEFAHIFVDLIPGGLENKRLKKALKELEGSELYAETKKLYPELSDEKFAKELLAQAIGREGAIQWAKEEDQSSFEGFLNWFFDFIKRTLGLERSAVKELTKELLSDVVVDTSKFFSESVQEQKTDPEVSSKLTQMEHVYEQVLTRLTNLHNMYKPKTRAQHEAENAAENVGKKTPRKNIQELEDEIKKLENIDKKKGLLKYISWSTNGLSNLLNNIEKSKKLTGEEGHAKQANEIVKFKNYLAAFEMLNDIKQLAVEELREGNLDKSTFDLIKKRIDGSITKIDDVNTALLSASRQNYAKGMVMYASKYKLPWKEKFRKEYLSVQPQGVTENEYIVQKMEENAQKIEDIAYQDYLSRAIESDMDISAASGLFSGEKNISSEEVQIISNKIDELDQNTDIFSQNEAGIFKENIESIQLEGTSNLDKYGKFLEITDNGSFLMNEYKSEFFFADMESKANLSPDVYKEKYKDIKVSKSGKHYTLDGLQKKFVGVGPGKVVGSFYKHINKKKPDITVEEAIAISERTYWKQDNISKKAVGRKTVFSPKKQWINEEYQKLSAEDKKQLDWFKSKAKHADRLYEGSNSLIKKSASQEFIQLPSVMASTLDRVLSGNVKSAAMDKIADITKVRKDEFEFEDAKKDEKFDEKDTIRTKAGIDNRESFNIPVPYRSKLEKEEQSYDLHSIFLLNLAAAKNYEQKSLLDDQINVFLDVMTNRANPQFHGINNMQKIHAFSSDKIVKLFKAKGTLGNDVKKMMDMRDNRIYGIKSVGSGTAHKKIGAILKWAGSASLLGNVPAETVNMLTGKINNFIEAVGGDVFNTTNLKNAKINYWKDLKDNLGDIGSNVQTSKTNVLMNVFNVLGDRNTLNHNFEENNRVKTLFRVNNMRALAQGGEHMMQGQVMYAILDNIKITNKKGQYINESGTVVSEKEAVSLGSVISVERTDDGGIEIKIPKSVEATTHTHTGGHNQILLETRSLIKKKIIDLHGAYDTDIQAAIQREWYGKLFFFLRKWMLPTIQRRWRGAATMGKAMEDMREVDKFYSEDLKSYQEGYYVTAFRFLYKTMPSAFKEAGFEGIKTGWKNMSKMEKANMRKMLSELASITLMSLIYAAMGGLDDDDDESTLYARYILRRELSELTFYMNPLETYKIAATPSATMGFVNKNLKLVNQLFSPTERYKQGKFKGEFKLSKMAYDIVPIKAQLQRDIDASLKFLQW